ncbi:MAG: LysE family translocator [Gammaproteobacteria bacterium]|nr:LysE family translocator [Gammaproteobacteria bacterium]
MNEYSFLFAIAAALLGGAMSPGPSFLVVAQNSLSKSRLHGVVTAIGTGLGAGFFALLAGLGVTALLEQTPTIYFVFRLAGGLYLIYLAYNIWVGATQPLASSSGLDQANESNLRSSLVKGFAVQVSNPKTVFIIASIFSAVMPSEPPLYTALLVTMMAFVIDFAWYALVALSLSKESSKKFYKKTKSYFDRFAAILLTALGCKLFWEIIF